MRLTKLLRTLSTGLLFISLNSAAAVITLNSGDDLQKALDTAQSGDTIQLSQTVYKGNFVIKKPLTVQGNQSVIDAEGQGSGLTIESPDVSVQGLTIQNYGSDLYHFNSGVLVKPDSHNVRLKNLTLRGPGFGIRADKSDNIVIEDSDIRGVKKMHVLDRGDGVFLHYVNNAELHGNKALYVRDGFYFENVENSNSSGNYFAASQYGIHYMYTRRNKAWNNKSEVCIGGFALMSSEQMVFHDNESARTVEFGILMNVVDKSDVYNNRIRAVHNRRGKAELDNEGKALFMFGPGSNRVYDNVLESSDIGISVAMGGEGTQVYGNAILDNRLQVRYVGTGSLEWSHQGRGNYWSNYQGWDLDRDGIGDRAFQPNDSIDRLFWLYPETRFLMESPVVVLLRFLSNQFELDKGKGITDSYPLISRPDNKRREA